MVAGEAGPTVVYMGKRIYARCGIDADEPWTEQHLIGNLWSRPIFLSITNLACELISISLGR
jgi:hypothetical protein